jgi:hypothetical protein
MHLVLSHLLAIFDLRRIASASEIQSHDKTLLFRELGFALAGAENKVLAQLAFYKGPF